MQHSTKPKIGAGGSQHTDASYFIQIESFITWGHKDVGNDDIKYYSRSSCYHKQKQSTLSIAKGSNFYAFYFEMLGAFSE